MILHEVLLVAGTTPYRDVKMGVGIQNFSVYVERSGPIRKQQTRKFRTKSDDTISISEPDPAGIRAVALQRHPTPRRTPSPAPFPDSHVQCSADWDKNHWPSFHLLNNVTRRANGELDMEDLNDANAIFQYRGLWHVMFQSGDGTPPYGWRWAHKVSNDLVHWYPIADALTPKMTEHTTWDDKGACDGTLSFPDLGTAPFDGTVPVILYGPDLGSRIWG